MKQSSLTSFFQTTKKKNGDGNGESLTPARKPTKKKRIRNKKNPSSCSLLDDDDAERDATVIVLEQPRVDPWQFSEVRRQVEYYLSDENLRRDDFYRNKIKRSEEGWFKIDYIMSAHRIKAQGVDVGDVVNALSSSVWVETKQDDDDDDDQQVWIRRRDNAPLPRKQGPAYSRKRGHYQAYYDDDGDDDDFDGGCMGYSRSKCETLLEHGVKPWDDDAGMVLGALRMW